MVLLAVNQGLQYWPHNICIRWPPLSCPQVPTHGLLNVVAAPHLGEASTYKAVTTAAARGSVRVEALQSASLGRGGRAGSRKGSGNSSSKDSKGKGARIVTAEDDEALLNPIHDPRVQETNRKLIAMVGWWCYGSEFHQQPAPAAPAVDGLCSATLSPHNPLI